MYLHPCKYMRDRHTPASADQDALEDGLLDRLD